MSECDATELGQQQLHKLVQAWTILFQGLVLLDLVGQLLHPSSTHVLSVGIQATAAAEETLA